MFLIFRERRLTSYFMIFINKVCWNSSSGLNPMLFLNVFFSRAQIESMTELSDNVVMTQYEIHQLHRHFSTRTLIYPNFLSIDGIRPWFLCVLCSWSHKLPTILVFCCTCKLHAFKHRRQRSTWDNITTYCPCTRVILYKAPMSTKTVSSLDIHPLNYSS